MEQSAWLNISQHQFQQNVPERFTLLLVNGCHDKDPVLDLRGVFLFGGFSGQFVLPSRNENKVISLPVVPWGNAERRHRQGAALLPCSIVGQVVSE